MKRSKRCKVTLSRDGLAQFKNELQKSLSQLTQLDFDPIRELSLFPIPHESSDFDIPQAFIYEFADIAPFRMLKKNLYRHPYVRTCCEPDDVPQCACKPDTGCDENCQNRLLYMECCSENCPSLRGASDTKACCKNSAIQTQCFPRTEIYPTQGCGYGLRMKEPVSAGTILCEYMGEVISADECKRRITTYGRTEDFYFAELENGLVLDAKGHGSVARFANHSCNPSCVLQKWIVQGEPRIVLVSKRDLVVGEPVTYNYNYFSDGLENEMRIRRQRCLCGSSNCCGSIGGRCEEAHDPFTQWMQKTKAILSGAKRYAVAAISDHIASLPLTSSSSAVHGEQRKALETLQQMIAEVEEWRCDVNRIVPHIVNADGRRGSSNDRLLIDSQVLCDLLKRQPHSSFIKVEESSLILDKLKKVIQAVKVVAKLKRLSLGKSANGDDVITRSHSGRIIEDERHGDCEGDDEEETEDNDKETEDTENKRVDSRTQELIAQYETATQLVTDTCWGSKALFWADVVGALEAIQSVVPFRIPGTEHLLKMLSASVSWARTGLSAFGLCIGVDTSKTTPATSTTERKYDVRSSNRHSAGKRRNNDELIKFKSSARSEAGLFQDLSAIYDPPVLVKLEGTADADNALVQETASRAEPPLDFINFCEFLEESVDFYLERNNSLLRHNNAASCSTTPSSSQKGSCGSRKQLHCLCQQEEQCTECNVFVQCDACDGWFHPQCVNDMAHFSRTPDVWKSNSRSEQGKQGTKRSSGGNNKVTKRHYECPTCLLMSNRLNQFVFAPKETAEWRMHSQYTMLPMFKKLSGTDGGTAKKHKHEILHSVFSFAPGQAITLDKLQELMDKEHFLPIHMSPAGVYLKLVQEYIKEWQQKVEQFFACPAVQVVLSDELSNRVRDQENGFALLAAVVMNEGLRLYYFPRVLRVVSQQLRQLRRLIWIVSMTPLVQAIRQGKWEQSKRVIHPTGNVAAQILAAVSIDEVYECVQASAAGLEVKDKDDDDRLDGPLPMAVLQKILHTGAQLQCQSTTACQVLDKLIKSVAKVYNASLVASTLDQCQQAEASLLALSHLVQGLDKSYSWARLCCVMLREQKATEFIPCTELEQLDSNIELYCWCRGGDLGTSMVCCDGCDEWFHNACMGLCPPSSGKKAKVAKVTKDSVLPAPVEDSNDNDSSHSGLGCSSTLTVQSVEGVADLNTDVVEADSNINSNSNGNAFYCISCCETRRIPYPHMNNFRQIM